MPHSFVPLDTFVLNPSDVSVDINESATKISSKLSVLTSYANAINSIVVSNAQTIIMSAPKTAALSSKVNTSNVIVVEDTPDFIQQNISSFSISSIQSIYCTSYDEMFYSVRDAKTFISLFGLMTRGSISIGDSSSEISSNVEFLITIPYLYCIYRNDDDNMFYLTVAQASSVVPKTVTKFITTIVNWDLSFPIIRDTAANIAANATFLTDYYGNTRHIYPVVDPTNSSSLVDSFSASNFSKLTTIMLEYMSNILVSDSASNILVSDSASKIKNIVDGLQTNIY
jgi:hypothetical protein